MLNKKPRLKTIKVVRADTLADLVKDAQMLTGQATRRIIIDGAVVDLGFDGQNLTMNGHIANDVPVGCKVKTMDL